MISASPGRHPLARLYLMVLLAGCSFGDAPAHPLDQTLARNSLQQAMQAWVSGRSVKELQPDIVVGDPAWEQGRKLVSFEILSNEETTDGSNLHIPVKRKFETSESTVTYIVGTSPVITIFPQ